MVGQCLTDEQGLAAVAGYLVGLIGNSNNPISGLTLTALLVAAVLMVAIGLTDMSGVAGVLAGRLGEHREIAFLSRELATLKRDLALDVDSASLAYDGAPRDACETLFEELGLSNFLAFVPRWRE